MSVTRQIAEAITAYRYTVVDEGELQEALERALIASGLQVDREVYLDSRNRIDFMVDGVGIEVKVAGKAASLVRQLHRYAKFESVKELVVVTTRSMHAHAIPESIDDKPVRTLVLRTGLL